MANQEHLDILKQGIPVWNEWRSKNPTVMPDLSDAMLDGLICIERGIDEKSYFTRAYHLNHVDFSGASLVGANFSGINLIGADFEGANLFGANFSIDVGSNHGGGYGAMYGAEMIGTDLRSADLSGADFTYAELQNAIFIEAHMSQTKFGDNDLSNTIGLDTVIHEGPSVIGVSAIYNSKGNISEPFLRGCGLSDWQIEDAKLYNPSLSNEEINNIQYRIHDLRVRQAIQISPLFISYSHTDSSFVDEIEKRFTEQGIRFWRDVHHAVAGRLERQIDAAIHLNDIVLIVLSEHSTSSDWVEHEARKAREKEKKTGKDALCPVALDDSWKTCRWPERLREQIMEYNILDFSNWQDTSEFQRMFGKLLEGLNLFYK